jgi:Taurine catabolism dioxygenase TauD, TfdA family
MPTPTDVQLDGLPDVVAITIPEQKYFDGLPFPLILTPSITGRSRSEWQQWIRDNLNTLKSLHTTYGAILFRGFSVDTPEDFDLFAKTFGWTEFPYVGGVSVRVAVAGNVYTSTEAPPECKIPFHHEMAHVADYPKVCPFVFSATEGTSIDQLN